MAPVVLIPEIVQSIINLLIYGWVSPLDSYGDPSSAPKQWSLLPDAGRYAAVSRLWQDVIERKTFAALRLDLDRLSQVNSILTPRRRAYVREIQLDVVLPRAGPLRSPETEDEKLRNNRTLQVVFEAFVQSMGQWKVAEVHPEGMKLSIDAFAPGDPWHVEERSNPPQWWLNRAAWMRRNAKSVLELTDPERIAQYPPVVAIAQLEGSQYTADRRCISPVAMCILLAKLPATKRAVIHWWNSGRFSRMRNDLADALSQINHPMDTFEMSSTNCIPMRQSQSSLESASSSEEDRLSKSIRILSQGLTELGIHKVVVSDEIFFPRALSLDIAEPRWDRLEVFCLDYAPITSSGEWLFLPDPNVNKSDSGSEAPASDDDSTDSSSNRPGSASKRGLATPAMQQFYLVAACAALQMPALKEMTLVAELELGEHWHKFQYHTYAARKSAAKALWTSSSEFIPDNEVLERWREVSMKYLGVELEVELLDAEFAV